MHGLLLRAVIATLHDRKGISALEYAIMAAAILGAISATIGGIGSDVTTLFTRLQTILNNAVSSSTPAG